MGQTDGEGNAAPSGPKTGPGTGGTGIRACTPSDFKDAAEGFLRVHDELAAVIAELAGVLKGCGGMAGSDHGAKEWADKYDPACGGADGAEGAMEAASDLINGIGMMHDLLYYTGAGRHNADNPDSPAFPPGSPPVFKVPNIPKAFGGDAGGAPPWWSLIMSYAQGALWPNGSSSKLKEAGGAYKRAADGARCAGSHIQSVIALVQQQNVPEAGTIIEWCNVILAQIETLAQQLVELGTCCEEYAQHIENAHEQIIDAAIDLAWQTVLIESAGALLSVFSAGAGEVGANAVEVGRLAAIGQRIKDIYEGFRMAAAGAALRAAVATGHLVEVTVKVRPLIVARASLFGGEAAEDAATAEELGSLADIVKYRRPYLRATTRAEIEAEAEKYVVQIEGKGYYTSATDRNVFMPKDKTWEGKTMDGKPVTSLNKDPTGKYFVDSQGHKYPVDPVWHYGHESGSEWWRIQEYGNSQKPPWTQQQMNDYVNDADHFRVEDSPGNLSHKFERPREGK